MGCEILRKYYDNPAITTDVIVGFPGETEEDFKITKAFVEKVHFYEMHIFKYSRRKGTVADTMPDQVDDKIKTARSNELIELANEMSAQYRSTYADSDLSVLIEEKQNIAGKEYYTGYTPNYIRVMISAEEFDKENVCSNSGNGNIINNIYKLIKINHVGQVIFNSTNLIMPHQFVQNKFVQEFVAVSLLIINIEFMVKSIQ